MMTKKRTTKAARPPLPREDREVMLQLETVTGASYQDLRKAQSYVVYCGGQKVDVIQAQVNAITTPAPKPRKRRC